MTVGKMGLGLAVVGMITPWVVYPLGRILRLNDVPGFSEGGAQEVLSFAVPVIALVISIVGVSRDESKNYAKAGLVISALTCCANLLQILIPLLLVRLLER